MVVIFKPYEPHLKDQLMSAIAIFILSFIFSRLFIEYESDTTGHFDIAVTVFGKITLTGTKGQHKVS